MLTKEFFYNLPEECIARYPAPNRTDSRLLGLNRTTGVISDYTFSDIAKLLRPGDLIVLNDTKVIRARLYGRKETGGKVEVLIERVMNDNTAWAQIRASKTPKPETWLMLSQEIRAKVQEFDRERGLFLLSFHFNAPLYEILEKYGEIPLPGYLGRAVEEQDQERYQTVYAEQLGSVAVPAAGLHFNEALLQELQDKGIEIGRLTLHVGAGTFQPVRVANLADHKMHAERIQVSNALCEQIIATKQRGGRVVAIGSTSVRALETAALNGSIAGTIQPFTGDTDIFITPGFEFKVVDVMLTNFHLPESSLLMMVSAFAGKDQIFNAYQHAINTGYRFFSYGDAMLIYGN